MGEHPVEVFHRQVPGDGEDVWSELAHRLDLGVVLVADLADDLLEQVFQGDDPLDPAELVHHDGHVQVHRLELTQDDLDGGRVGHEVDGAQQDLQVDVAGTLHVLEQVFDVEDADDVLEVVPVDRDS